MNKFEPGFPPRREFRLPQEPHETVKKLTPLQEAFPYAMNIHERVGAVTDKIAVQRIFRDTPDSLAHIRFRTVDAPDDLGYPTHSIAIGTYRGSEYEQWGSVYKDQDGTVLSDFRNLAIYLRGFTDKNGNPVESDIQTPADRQRNIDIKSVAYDPFFTQIITDTDRAGYTQLTDNQTLDYLRLCAHFMGDHWPADLEIPEDTDQDTIFTHSTAAFFQKATERIKPTTITRNSQWQVDNTEYMLNSITDGSDDPISIHFVKVKPGTVRRVIPVTETSEWKFGMDPEQDEFYFLRDVDIADVGRYLSDTMLKRAEWVKFGAEKNIMDWQQQKRLADDEEKKAGLEELKILGPDNLNPISRI